MSFEKFSICYIYLKQCYSLVIILSFWADKVKTNYYTTIRNISITKVLCGRLFFKLVKEKLVFVRYRV